MFLLWESTDKYIVPVVCCNILTIYIEKLFFPKTTPPFMFLIKTISGFCFFEVRQLFFFHWNLLRKSERRERGEIFKREHHKKRVKQAWYMFKEECGHFLKLISLNFFMHIYFYIIIFYSLNTFPSWLLLNFS